MFPDSVTLQWEFTVVSLIVSVIIFGASRMLWFFGRFLIYATFASVSSWQWVVRCCVRLWMCTGWDIGAAIFGMVGDKWGVYSSGSSGTRIVRANIGYLAEGGNRTQLGGQEIELPEDGDASEIDPPEALELSFSNINRMDKRQWYRDSFQTNLTNMVEMQNAKQLQKQARRK